MSFLDWLVKKKKPLSKMTRSELRRQELLLEKDRNQLLKRIKKLAVDKQDMFEKGAGEKTPEVRKTLAQEFELKTSEQLMISRQLNIRSKELLTVSRLRMIRENHERAQAAGSRFGLISETDVIKLGKLIESDAVTSEVYQERLDRLLEIGAGVDEGAAGLTEAGQEVLNIWDKMDRGVFADPTEAFDEADRRVREQQTADPEGS
jgi:hypothetical protein